MIEIEEPIYLCPYCNNTLSFCYAVANPGIFYYYCTHPGCLGNNSMTFNEISGNRAS